MLRAAAEVAPPGTTVVVSSIHDIPLYDGDVETRDGVPEVVQRLKDAIAAADGLLLASPEYNHSIPGVMKNAIDWLSRPNKDIKRVFGDKPVGLMGASTGPGGTRLVQAAWQPVFRTLGVRPWFGKMVHLAEAAKAFDEDGVLRDDKIREVLTAYMAGFAAFAAPEQPAPAGSAGSGRSRPGAAGNGRKSLRR